MVLNLCRTCPSTKTITTMTSGRQGAGPAESAHNITCLSVCPSVVSSAGGNFASARTVIKERHNFNLDSTHQAGQVRNKERNTEEHREPQTDVEQQGGETPPHKPGPPAGLREGLARALEAGGPELRPPEPRPTERGGRADAPPGTPAAGALRASAAGSEEPEAATKVRSLRDAP